MHCQSQEESQVGGKTAAISQPMYVIPGISALVGKCFHIQAASSWTHKHFALLQSFSFEIVHVEIEYLWKYIFLRMHNNICKKLSATLFSRLGHLLPNLLTGKHIFA